MSGVGGWAFTHSTDVLNNVYIPTQRSTQEWNYHGDVLCGCQNAHYTILHGGQIKAWGGLGTRIGWSPSSHNLDMTTCNGLAGNL